MKLYKQRDNFSKKVKEHIYNDRHGYVSALSSIYRKELKANATKTELIVKEFLDKEKISHKFQKTFINPFHRIVDFYIPKKKLIIEIDGGYHKETVGKDKIKDSLWLKERGCQTIRILNEDVLSGKYENRLLDFIEMGFEDFNTENYLKYLGL